MSVRDPGALWASATGGHRDTAERQSLLSSISPIALQLRPYQENGIARIDAAIAAGKRRILVVAPTGAGKTVVAARIMKGARDRGERVLFIDHRREITEQTCKKLFAAGLDFGVIQAGFPSRPGALIQVASVATLYSRAVRSKAMQLPSADVVIVDEAHHARAATWQAILDRYPEAVVVGLTATPCRADGRGLGNLFDELIEIASVRQLTDLGFLVPTLVYAPVRPDLTGIRVRAGDYVESELARRVDTDKLVGDVIEQWLEINTERRRTVIYAVNVAHSKHIRDEFRRAGVLAEHIDGSTPIEERDRILKQLSAGEIEIIVNCQVLCEGWDCPEVGCIILARPTKSLGLFRQMIGRGLRPCPAIDKTNVLVLDHSGAVFQHGFIDDDIAWTLATDRRAENTTHSARGQHDRPGLTTCPECHALRLQGQPCRTCGWHPTPKARHVDFVDGVLGEVNRDRTVSRVIADSDEQRAFYAELLWIARERGYKPGWAAHKFKQKYGDWPIAWEVTPRPPSAATRAWVRSRDIAYAKAKQAQRQAGAR